MILASCIALQAAHPKDLEIANKKTVHQGMKITIEAPRGTDRVLHDDEGKQVYRRRMYHDYGYIDGTKGRDGDEVDCFVGPITNAPEVFIIHMKDMGANVTEREDEDKCFIGFSSADTAKAAFLMHYPASFYDGMTSLPVDVFKKRLAQASQPHRKKKITAAGMQCPRCARAYDVKDRRVGYCQKCGRKLKPQQIAAGGPGSGRHPGTMQPSEINKELEDNRKKSSVLNQRMIEEGRGSERPSEYRKKSDELSQSLTRILDRHDALHQEIATRYGPGAPSYMPKGFKPRMKAAIADGAVAPAGLIPGATGKGKTVKACPGCMGKKKCEACKGMSTASMSCPKCASKKIVLMPTDFETAKCKDCGKTWNSKEKR